MRPGFGACAALAALACAPAALRAQDLTPRAYVITPVRSNAVIASYIFNDGELLFDGTVPITGATGRLNVPVLSLYHSMSVFGRSANVTATLPYGVGTFKGTVAEAEVSAYRSGLLDSVFRFSVNLMGAPAMELSEMRKWRQGHMLGASVKIVAPTGQYDPAKLINLGGNRWAFKPELGYSGRFGNFVLDGYAAVWLFTKNPEFFSRNQYFAGTRAQTQEPIVAFETHISYDFKPRLWISADVNYWRGGRASVNGVANNETLQANSRFGVTGSVPLTSHQAIKVSYSDGFIVRIGGNYKILSMGWQYGWFGTPFKGN